MVTDTADKVIDAATRAFAASGFEGASVRNICKAAGVNAQAIHYHFGSKEKLYVAVLKRFADEQDAIVGRLVTTAAASVEDLRTRLLFFLDTALEFWVRTPGLEVAYLEGRRNGPYQGVVGDTMIALDAALVRLLEASQKAGHVREGVDLQLVGSTLVERLGAQAVDADLMERVLGYSMRDAERRREFVGKLIDVVLFGIANVRAASGS